LAFSPELRYHILEFMEPLGPVAVRSIFRAAGVFLERIMFALMTRADVLYLRSDNEIRGGSEAAGMDPFRTRAGKIFFMSYHEAPPEAMEDPDAMQWWADLAWGAVRRGRHKKARRTGKDKRP